MKPFPLKTWMNWMKPSLTRNDLLASLASGFLLVLSFPPWEFYPAIWIALVPLFWRIQDDHPRTNASMGLVTGVVFYGGTLYWLFHVTIPGTVLLIGIHAVLFSLLSYVTGKLRRSFYAIPVISLTWTGIEYLREVGPFSFAWNFLGHAVYPWTEILQFTQWFGVPGLTFLIVGINLSLAEFIRFLLTRRKHPSTIPEPTFSCTFPQWMRGCGNFAPTIFPLTFMLVFSLHLLGQWRISNDEFHKTSNISYRVSLIQANFTQGEKEASPVEDSLRVLLQLSRDSLSEQPGLLIWPESSITSPINYWPTIIEKIQEFVDQNQVDLLVGSVYGEYGADQRWSFYNRAFLFRPGASFDVSQQPVDLSSMQYYDKIHLVPFGEWVPFGNHWPFTYIETLIEEAGAGIFERGRQITIFTTSNGIQFATAICFESTLARQLATARSKGAQFLVNITNDAWFKRSAGLKQHFVQSVFRAVENQCYVLRAANTGITGVVDPYGNITVTIPSHERGYCVYEMELPKRQ